MTLHQTTAVFADFGRILTSTLVMRRQIAKMERSETAAGSVAIQPRPPLTPVSAAMAFPTQVIFLKLLIDAL